MTYTAMKVEGARTCTDLADCDEGMIEVQWTGPNCEGNVSYSVHTRASDTNVCLPDEYTTYAKTTCSASAKEVVFRSYADSACKSELSFGKFRLEYCVNRAYIGIASNAYFCSKQDAANKVPAVSLTPPTTGYAPYNWTFTQCVSNDKLCTEHPNVTSYSQWDNSLNCQPRSSPQHVTRTNLELGVCYANHDNITFYRTTCGANAYYEHWYTNGCDQSSWYRERTFRTALCVPTGTTDSTTYHCPSQYSSPAPTSDSARIAASSIFGLLATFAMVFLGM